jgi:hypothetical protein
MFYAASTFNQDLSNWNVSGGILFVSYGQLIQFDALCSLVWLCFQVGFRVKFITDIYVDFEETRALKNDVFHFFLYIRMKCLMGLLPLIKTFALGDLK